MKKYTLQFRQKMGKVHKIKEELWAGQHAWIISLQTFKVQKISIDKYPIFWGNMVCGLHIVKSEGKPNTNLTLFNNFQMHLLSVFAPDWSWGRLAWTCLHIVRIHNSNNIRHCARTQQQHQTCTHQLSPTYFQNSHTHEQNTTHRLVLWKMSRKRYWPIIESIESKHLKGRL